MLKVFIDSTAWISVIGTKEANHELAIDYFQQLLESRAQLYTNIFEIDEAINELRKKYTPTLASEFSKTIEDSVLSSNLTMTWIGRRFRKSSLRQFFSFKEMDLKISHIYIYEDIWKRKINVIFSFDESLKSFGIPLMPQPKNN